MALVGYSDSEESSDEGSKAVQKTRSKPATTKLAFQKVTDRTNPHKIRVSLPETSKTNTSDGLDNDEPPAKKARIGGGSSGLGGFNSLLPAPKKTTATSTVAGRGRDLGSGVNLKTGSTPGFSREPALFVQAPSTGEVKEGHESGNGADGGDTNSSFVHPAQGNTDHKETREPHKVGNAMIFKPLSVARKPAKKKKTNVPASSSQLEQPSVASEKMSEQESKPKVSLFSIGVPNDTESSIPGRRKEYEPLIHLGASDETETDPPIDPISEANTTAQSSYSVPTDTSSTPQSLSSIAADLNLSASARRQLFGRHGANASAINVVNFNTDAEYKANEEFRALGEQPAHNPVRAIAPGKHSLKQLVNAVSNQKDALEEQFATGRRNKREAGSKYGW